MKNENTNNKTDPVLTMSVDGKNFKYRNPYLCHNTSGTRIENVITYNKEYILARIYYKKEEKTSLAVRWHISENEWYRGDTEEVCMGYPNTFGNPTWFVIPETLLNEIQSYLTKGKAK